MALAPHTRALHLALIRFAKGVIDAWERWVAAEDAAVPETRTASRR